MEEEDEEDVKPTIEYLDSLNDYRKRARSPAFEPPEEPVAKAPRFADEPIPEAMPPPMDAEDDMEGVAVTGEDDPIVYGRVPYLVSIAAG
jgi:transcription initiation factor TFIIE subunit alpha